MDREKDDNIRHELDLELDSIRSLLAAPDPLSASLAKADAGPLAVPKTDADRAYDQFVREFAFDKRARPKDRTKTEEELALEEKEALEKAERKRIRRMNGEEGSDEEGSSLGKRKRRGGGKSGDDLEDDFYDEDKEWGALGAGLEGVNEAGEDDDEEDEEEDEEEEGEGEDEDEDSETGGGGEDSEEDVEEAEGSEKTADDLVSSKKRPAPKVKVKELPFTFPCPATHEELLDVVESFEDKDIPTIVQRIRTLHHPSLGEDNKFKLQVCLFYPAGIAELTDWLVGIGRRSNRLRPLHHGAADPSLYPPYISTPPSLRAHKIIPYTIGRVLPGEALSDAEKSQTRALSRSNRTRREDVAGYSRAGLAPYHRVCVVG